MILSAASIVDVIFNLPFVLDIIIIVFLLISTSLGCAKGFWRGTFRFLFVVLMLVISWFFLVDSVATYIKDDLFIALKITETIDGNKITTLGGLIESLIKTAPDQSAVPEKFLDPVYMEGFIFALCKTVAWLLLVLIIQFVSWILSSIIYFLLIRMIIPKRIRSVKLRLLGGVMGLLQGVLVAFALMIPFSAISPAIGAINNPGQKPFSWISEYATAIIKGFDPSHSMLEPYSESIGKSLAEDLFNFKTGEKDYSLDEELLEYFKLTSTFDKTPAVEATQIN